MGFLGKLKESFARSSGSGDVGAWGALMSVNKDAMQEPVNDERDVDIAQINAERQRRKVLAYFASGGDIRMIQRHDVGIDQHAQDTVLEKMRSGEIGKREEARFLGEIVGNMNLDDPLARRAYQRVMADRDQWTILAIALGRANDSNISEISFDEMCNFVDRRMGVAIEDDYSTPVGFENFREEFLESIKSSGNTEDYRDALIGINKLEKNIYGKQFEYFQQLKVLHEMAGAPVRKDDLGNVWNKLRQQDVKGEDEYGRVEKSYREISAIQQTKIMNRAVLNGDAYRAEDGYFHEVYKDDYVEAGLGPRFEVEIGDKKVYLSPTFNIVGSRVAAIGYVPNESGEMKMRSYYRSNSQGLWRYLPDYVRKESGGISWYGKGYSEEALNLPMEMQRALNEIVADDEVANEANEMIKASLMSAKELFAGTAAAYESKDDYRRNLHADTMRGDFYKEVEDRGVVMASRLGQALPRPEEVECGLAYKPDFEEKVTDYEARTSLAGDVKAEVFKSNDGSLRWTFFKTPQEQAWIGQVETSAPITSTGVRSKWVRPGVLATPLYEYPSQADSYGDMNDERHGYVSMWRNYLSKIPVIKDYLRNSR